MRLIKTGTIKIFKTSTSLNVFLEIVVCNAFIIIIIAEIFIEAPIQIYLLLWHISDQIISMSRILDKYCHVIGPPGIAGRIL